MKCKFFFQEETDSTNRWLMEHGTMMSVAAPAMGQGSVETVEGLCAWTDFQTAGRGCGTNTWESERGKNLTFSLLCHPVALIAARQFQVSMAISVTLLDVLEEYLTGTVCIKWPNDIYVGDSKICGILIENKLQGTVLRDSIIGVGLNVNQREFVSDAPNPVSLYQLLGHELDRERLLRQIVERFDPYEEVATRYRQNLYRREGFYPYRDADGDFEAELIGVEDDGHLLLRDREGCQRRYAFKEVAYII